MSLVVPEYVHGEWTNLVVLTYTAHLDFFETHLLKQLTRVPNRIVLADDARLAEQFAGAARSGQRLRHANRTYLAAPIRNQRAAHAKAVLLTTATEGRLLVGSGNLGLDGYAQPGELWHLFQYTEDLPRHRDAFAAVRALADGIVEHGWLDPIAVAALDSVWDTTPWLPVRPTSDQPLCDNLDTPLIDAVTSAVTGPVDQLTVHAPFYDKDVQALATLLDRLRPDRLRVLLTADTSVDGDRLAAVVNRPGLSSDLLEVVPAEPAFLHAKFIHVASTGREVLVTGSANLSQRALLSRAAAGNIELAVIESRPPGGFDALYAPLTLRPLAGAAELDIRYRGRPAESPAPGAALHYSELHAPWLTLVFTAPVDGSSFRLCFPDGAELRPVAVRITAERVVLQLRTPDVEALTKGGHLQVYRDDAEPVPTWPYHVDALRGRLQRAVESTALQHAGDLPEHDDELLETLLQLEQTLIFDGRSAWRTGRPGTPPPNEDDDAPDRWEDIDWERLYRHPRYRAYGRVTAGTAPRSDIQIILTSISARLAGTPQPHPETPDDDKDEDEDLGKEFSEADESDEDPAEQPGESARERRTRNGARQAANRLARRYTAALRDETLLGRLGSTLTVHNAAIFNDLLWQLLDRERIDIDAAVTAQVELWSFLWGDGVSSGLLASLGEEERRAAERLLADLHSRETTLSALLDLSTYSWGDDGLKNAVARQTRALICSDTFDLMTQRPNTDLIDGLAWLARPTDHDMITAVLRPLGLPATAAGFETVEVMRAGQLVDVEVLLVHEPIPDLTPAAARAAMARLIGQYTAGGYPTDYFRIRFATGYDVIIWNNSGRTGTCLIGDHDEDLDELHPELPEWWQWLTALRR